MSELERELYNEHKGMVTAQSDFNQDPETARWLRNSFIMSNGTRRKVEGTSLVSEDLSDNPVHNVVPYVSITGLTEWIIQVQNKWLRLEDDGTTTLLQEIADTQKHGHTQFKGRLIVGSRRQKPNKYYYLQDPLEPTTSSITGGTDSGEPQRTYYIRVAYETANGKTEASINTSQTVAADQYLKVSAPTDQEGADGWSVYVSEIEGEENLQKQNLGMNTDYDEETHGLVSDAENADYPTENNAWVWEPLGGNPPRAQYWHTHNGRVFCSGVLNDDMEVRYSGLNNEDDWSIDDANADGSGALEFDLEFSQGDAARGLASLQDRIIFFFEDHIAVYNFGADHTSITRAQIMQGKGCVTHESIVNVGGDVFWLSKYGVESLSQEFGVENLLFDDENPSAAVNPTLAEDTQAVVEAGNEHLIESAYYPLNNWVIFQIPQAMSSDDVIQQRWWLFDLDSGEWTFTNGMKTRSFGVNREETLYAGTSGKLLEVFDGSWDRQGDAYDFEWTTPWLYLGDPNLTKALKFVVVPFESNKETDLTLTVVTDMGEAITEQQRIDLPVQDQSQWSVARWSEGQFSSTVKRIVKIPVQVTGRAFQLVWEHSDDADLRIPWYQLLYIPGSDR